MDLRNNINSYNPSRIVLITGGTKSGKSEFAEHIAKKSKNLTYIALSENRINDNNWEKKISIHRKRRPENWELIETTDLLDTLNKVIGPILIDSIGGFVMESIDIDDNEWKKKMKNLIDVLQNRNYLTVIVGEQVGWSLVSEYKIGNIYIERIGDLLKLLSNISKDNWIAINGRAIKIDEISLEIPFY